MAVWNYMQKIARHRYVYNSLYVFSFMKRERSGKNIRTRKNIRKNTVNNVVIKHFLHQSKLKIKPILLSKSIPLSINLYFQVTEIRYQRLNRSIIYLR